MIVDIRQGDLPGALAGIEDDSVDAVFGDPPYALGDLPAARFRHILAAWLAGKPADHLWGSGFLNRKWDTMPGPEMWAECYRILKPGGHAVLFTSSRTYGLLDVAVRLAGFEILPAIAWIYAQAMALGMDVGKAIDAAAGAKREVVERQRIDGKGKGFGSGALYGGWRDPQRALSDIPATDLAATFDEYRTRMRSMLDLVLVARKPHDGTVAENAERWGVAGLNVGACRIPRGEADAARVAAKWSPTTRGNEESYGGGWSGDRNPPNVSRGQLPGNVVISCECVGDHAAGCPVREVAEMGRGPFESKGVEGVSSKRLASGVRKGRGIEVGYGWTSGVDRFYFQARAGTAERLRGLEGWFWRRAPETPEGWERVPREEWEAIGAEAEDQFWRSWWAKNWREVPYEAGKPPIFRKPIEITGSHAEAERTMKAAEAARERDRHRGSPHQAHKPLALLAWLARLILPPTLDPDRPPRVVIPFAGSGSEVIGALYGGWRHVTTIEGSPVWVEMSRERVAWWQGWLEAGATSIEDVLAEPGAPESGTPAEVRGRGEWKPPRGPLWE